MIAILTKKLLEKLLRKSYREAYVEENVRTGVAYQIRAIREQRGWSQKKFAEILGKPQSVLSRIEDPDYGKLSVQTLLEVASAFDVGLLVQYVDFPNFLERTRDVSPGALEANSFDKDQFFAVDGSSKDVLPLLQKNLGPTALIDSPVTNFHVLPNYMGPVTVNVGNIFGSQTIRGFNMIFQGAASVAPSPQSQPTLPTPRFPDLAHVESAGSA